MCFAIPYKVMEVKENFLLLEGGKKARAGKEDKVKVGDYVQILDTVVVKTLSPDEGRSIRKLIESLHIP